MATYRSAMSPSWALQCLIVLVAAGLVVSVWAVDSDSEADYKAFLAAHKALFDAKQLVATQSTKKAPIGAPAAAPAANGPSVGPGPVGPGPVGPPLPCSRTVGPKGSGATYTTATAAIKSIPAGSTQRFVICFAAGTYTEKVTLPATKPYITFKGAGASVTTIQWGDDAAKAGSTAKSASVLIASDFFIAEDIAFKNTAPAPAGGAVGKQAVAFSIAGDKAQFYRVAFYGAQDTLYDKKGRHYFKDCYIEGSIDFIFGDGQSYYETCHLNSIAIPGSGSLTAQKRLTKSELSGFVFVNCLVTGSGPIYLGRAWGPYSRVVFLLTQINAPIIPAGWFDWGIPARDKTVYYGQYKCTGVGASTVGRVMWSKDLTDAEAQPFLSWSFVDGSTWIGKV